MTFWQVGYALCPLSTSANDIADTPYWQLARILGLLIQFYSKLKKKLLKGSSLKPVSILKYTACANLTTWIYLNYFDLIQ